MRMTKQTNSSGTFVCLFFLAHGSSGARIQTWARAATYAPAAAMWDPSPSAPQQELLIWNICGMTARLAVWPWESYLTSLDFDFHLWNIEELALEFWGSFQLPQLWDSEFLAAVSITIEIMWSRQSWPQKCLGSIFHPCWGAEQDFHLKSEFVRCFKPHVSLKELQLFIPT